MFEQEIFGVFKNRGLFIASFLLLMASQLAFAKEKFDIRTSLDQALEGRRTSCQNEMYRTTRVDTYFSSRFENSLEHRFCERMLIRSPKEAFSEGRDLPADRLNASEESFAWFSESSGYFDLGALTDLNKEAIQLWNKMVECHGSAEKARSAYFRLDGKCGLNLELQRYSQSVQLFLSTSPIFQSQYKISGSFHPLLAQVLIETLSANGWLPGDPSNLPMIDVYSGFMIRIMSEGKTVPEVETMRPEESSHQIGAYAVKMALKSNPALRYYFQRLNRRLNAFSLLNQNVSLDRCENWGLWPGASRVAIKMLDMDHVISSLKTDQLQDKIYQACGDVRYSGSLYSGEGRNSISIGILFRNMATRFEPKN